MGQGCSLGMAKVSVNWTELALTKSLSFFLFQYVMSSDFGFSTLNIALNTSE